MRAGYFPTYERPSMTISDGKLRFNTACLKKFEDVEYVELLLNTTKNCIAIRPCDKENPNAIHWGRLREKRWVVSTRSCRGFSQTLFDLMGWDPQYRYKMMGKPAIYNGEMLFLFRFMMSHSFIKLIPIFYHTRGKNKRDLLWDGVKFTWN